ncbi:MAG: alternative ribosome rescue aminoacyl-tRNA hydrolase ArfB [Chitinivibrionales bacterium]|nr:alternative ribosome rescue aminoacyl-tRNA hydrolase ArfB [Chitinivibrionales bacterium]
MLTLSETIAISDQEIIMHAVRSSGAGGQNVNKVSTAIHLQFDIRASSLPEIYKERLLQLRDKRITDGGVVVIKAQTYRTQERNKADALLRLEQLIKSVGVIPKTRIPTRSTSRKKRLEGKAIRGRIKLLRQRVGGEE